MIYATLGLALIVGCSPAPIAEKASQETSVTTMDVPPGDFESHLVDYPYFLGRTETKVRLTVSETRLHDKWAPMASLCLYESEEGAKQEVCLQFVHQISDGQFHARQYARVRGEEPPSISNLGKNYTVASPLHVSIREASEHTAFLVNREPLLRVSGAPRWKRLEYSCSSAVCKFEFLR